MKGHCDSDLQQNLRRKVEVDDNDHVDIAHHMRHFMSLRLRSTACFIKEELSIIALKSAHRGPGLPLIQYSGKVI